MIFFYLVIIQFNRKNQNVINLLAQNYLIAIFDLIF
jgi:hypothetical protein